MFGLVVAGSTPAPDFQFFNELYPTRMICAGSQESGKAQLDWNCAACAYKAKAGILQNETVWANAAKMPPAAWYEMYVKPWHPELAKVGNLGMRVLTGDCPELTETAC